MSTTQARVRRKPPQERAEDIAEAACAIAREDGIGALTQRAVAARAGVTPALVSHYAKSMDLLLATTFQRIVKAERLEIAAMLDAASSVPERIDLLLDTMIDRRRDDVTLIWVESWALGLRNETFATTVRSEMDAWSELIAGVVRQGVESGVFHVADPSAAAWQILGMVDGLNAQSLVRWGDSRERGSMLHSAIDGVLGTSQT